MVGNTKKIDILDDASKIVSGKWIFYLTIEAVVAGGCYYQSIHVVSKMNQVIVDREAPCKVRDGVTLYANIYRPAGNGNYPVLLTYH